jgi:hypothetical protein
VSVEQFESDADQSASAILYARPLTSGGYVAIEAQQRAGASYRACVYVERRTDPLRRQGHVPPVIAEYEGPTRLAVMHELYRVAADDDQLRSGVARWAAQRNPGSDQPSTEPPGT